MCWREAAQETQPNTSSVILSSKRSMETAQTGGKRRNPKRFLVQLFLRLVLLRFGLSNRRLGRTGSTGVSSPPRAFGPMPLVSAASRAQTCGALVTMSRQMLWFNPALQKTWFEQGTPDRLTNPPCRTHEPVSIGQRSVEWSIA